MSDFKASRGLLNPKFEGYKLSLLEQNEHVSRFPLIARPSQTNISGRTKIPLSFQEVQSRITHNHLSVSCDGDYAIYIDENFNVIKVTVSNDGQPAFQTLTELPKAVRSPDNLTSVHVEYPSAISLSRDYWIVSDGCGLLYVIRLIGELVDISASHHLAEEDATLGPLPFNVVAAQHLAPDAVVCALSYRNMENLKIVSHEAPRFNLVLVSMNLEIDSENPIPLQLIWKGEGEDVPIYAIYDQSKQAFAVLGNTFYRKVGSPNPPSYEPSGDEIMPIPRAAEFLATNPEKPPPYSWVQTQDSVTVAFPLPSDVPKEAIHVTISAQTLSILVKYEVKDPAVELPRYSLKRFWDAVRPSTSFWTWDKEAESRFGLLSLHLDKQHEVKWLHVFADTGKAAAGAVLDPSDREVPETLDPSELWHIREVLEKYTSAIREGDDASGLGLGRGVPSLAEGELDETVDTNVGRKFWVTWINADGLTPSWINDVEGVPSALLSVPLSPQQESSLIIRSDIDGLLYTLRDDNIPTWEHTATYPALAFVLASKQDTRFTYHVSSKTVLAFESGTATGSGNLYIYRGSNATAKSAKQSILKVSGGPAGALLGVGAIRTGDADSNTVVVCLCEQELVIIKNL